MSPMYDAGGYHYYVFELSCLKNGEFIIPLRWVNVEQGSKKIVHTDAYAVTLHNVRMALYHWLSDDLTFIQGCLSRRRLNNNIYLHQGP